MYDMGKHRHQRTQQIILRRGRAAVCPFTSHPGFPFEKGIEVIVYHTANPVTDKSIPNAEEKRPALYESP
jgi:hypothetical protein